VVDDKIEVEINDKDLRIDTHRSSGAGVAAVQARRQSSHPPSPISDAIANCEQRGGTKFDGFPDASLCDERPDRRSDPLTIRLIERGIGLHVTMQRLGILEIYISNAPSPDALDPVNLDGAQAGGAHLG
jgi:hypothetical protein